MQEMPFQRPKIQNIFGGECPLTPLKMSSLFPKVTKFLDPHDPVCLHFILTCSNPKLSVIFVTRSNSSQHDKRVSFIIKEFHRRTSMASIVKSINIFSEIVSRTSADHRFDMDVLWKILFRGICYWCNIITRATVVARVLNSAPFFFYVETCDQDLAITSSR